jgi:SOS-response transcriptional repressor LexA
MTHSDSKERLDFSRRLNQALDEAGVAEKGHGRQSAVAKMLGVTPGATRKYLEGLGYAEKSRINILAKKLNVRAAWLEHGESPMRLSPIIGQGDIGNMVLWEEVLEACLERIYKGGHQSLSFHKQAQYLLEVYAGSMKDGHVNLELADRLLRLIT